jgi:single-stranded-DNA-specific exonuclease
MDPISGNRQWKLRGQSNREESEISRVIDSLQKETGLSPITLRVCVLRGLDTAAAIHDYLSPRFENLKSPFSIQDMDVAVQRLIQAQEQNEVIRIFGDYDVDGTTGAALLSWIFRDLGYRFDAKQPDRFKDGYGLNVGAVEQASRDGVQILVTVDCGITSFDAAQKAKDLGIELIIVDHHQLDANKGLPPAYAVVNPQRPDCESGLKQLCGCGLAFYLALALRSRARDRGWFKTRPEPNLKQHLDLVVMATAADMVPLIGDNHILVKYGLEVLKHTKKPGVKALLDAAGLGAKDISPSHLGFVLGPRINASGRMHSASLALELLTTTDFSRAMELALHLEKLNQERADIQNQIWDEVRVRVEKGIEEGKYRHGIAVADPGWHEGVVGIVATRVTEMFKKPAAVVALREDFGKGSVRSFGGKDVLSALRQCSSVLLGFGGHKHAAGLSVDLDRFDEFAERFDAALGEISAESHAETLFMEGACSIDQLNIKTLQELEKLGPFGPGNPEPVFSVRASIRDHRVLKGRHLKMNLLHREPAQTHAPSLLEAIWFHAAERQEVLNDACLGEEREWAGVPELNRFRGQMTPTLRVRDWRRIGVGV